MPQQSFSARIAADVAKIKALRKPIRDEAAQRVIEIMQTPVSEGGNMPFKSGFLRASLTATIGAPSFVVRTHPGGDGSFAYNAGAVSLVILDAELEQPISAVYTAIYSRVAEYGGQNRPARRFVGLAAQQWQRVVSEVAAGARQRAGV